MLIAHTALAHYDLFLLGLSLAVFAVWTTPRTWVAAELVSASIMNQHVRDNLQYLFDTMNWLDGAFVPVLAFGGASVGITYTLQSGAYTRFNDTYFLQAVITLTSKGSSTGAATVTGHPATTSPTNSPVYFGGNSGFTGLAGSLVGFIAGTTMSIQDQRNDGAGNVVETKFTNTSAFYWSAMHKT